jgi:hypothetical protein
MPIGSGALGILLTEDGIKRSKWLLVVKSRKKRALNSIGELQQTTASLTVPNKTARTIYSWVFSWAQPSYCETGEEYISIQGSG